MPEEHKLMFEAAMARETTRAAEILMRHLERTGRNVMAILTETAPADAGRTSQL